MIIIKIVIFIYLIATFSPLITYVLEKKYKQKIKTQKIKKYLDIYVLLPCYKEQKIVNDTINWFKQFKYKGKIKFIMITTEKEESKKSFDLTTKDLIQKKLNKLKDKRFVNIHYPYIEGNKSSQMNYALDILKENINDNAYISVFDFDSRPSLDTFDNLNKVYYLKNEPDVINQVPLNIQNFEEISKKNILMIIYTLQHLVRSIAIEKLKLLLCSLRRFKIPQYCMGACMHIKYSTLKDNNFFPIFVDDLTLGYRLSIKGSRFAYLPSLNLNLIYNDIKNYINSSTLIFKGISTYLSEIKNIKGYFIGKVKMFIFGSLNIIEFILIPVVFLIIYVLSLLKLKLNILSFIAILIPILWSISSLCVIKYNKIKFNLLNTIIAILLSPIWFIFRPLGFLSYFIKKLKSILFKSNIEYKKTER